MGLLSTIGAASGRAFGLTRVGAAIRDAYFNLTTLLLPGNGTNGAQNNTFLDSSSNNFTITRNGNTTQGTFSPFSQTGWSNYVSATSGSVGFSNSAAALVSSTTSTFTAECWIYMTEAPVSGDGIPALIGMDATFNSSIYLGFGPNASRNLVLRWFDGASKTATGGTALALNTWYHIAVVANSNALAMYVNGVAETLSGTTTLTNRNGTTNNFSLLLNSSSSNYQFRGYASNIRVCTSAVYTGAFTPSTSPLTTTSQGATNCKLLTAQDNRFIDNSSNAYTLTLQSTPSVQAFSPFAPTAAYSAATVGGSGYFDGSGDYLNLATQTAFNCGTGNWTLETWVYITTRTTTYPVMLGNNNGSYSAGALVFGNSNADTGAYNDKFIITGYDSTLRLAGATTNVKGAWYHVAVVRDSSTSIRLYVNGVQDASNTSLASGYTFDWGKSGLLIGGGNWDGAGSYFNGYLFNMRLIKGTAVYTGAFTPPTAPLSTSGAASASAYPSTTNVNTTFAASECSLLTNFTNAGITDATAKNDLETVGNAQISTTQSKFGGSSMYFDGTGDYLVVGNMSTNPNLALLAGDFTIEYWYYPLNTSIHATLNNLDDGAGNGSIWILMNGTFSGGSKVQFGYNTGGANGNILFGTGTFTANAWYHVAICRSGSNLRCFINGTQEGSTSTALGTGSIVAYNRNLVIGATLTGGAYTAYNLNGYLDDFRVTKFARYTANFTAPTAAFPLQ